MEEYRHIRQLEAAQLANLREKLLQQEADSKAGVAQAGYEARINPIMEEVAAVLEATGDSVTHEGLEKLALWKLAK